MVKNKPNDKSSTGGNQAQGGDTAGAELAEESQSRGTNGGEGQRKATAVSRSRQRSTAATAKNKNSKEGKKENALDDAEMY